MYIIYIYLTKAVVKQNWHEFQFLKYIPLVVMKQIWPGNISEGIPKLNIIRAQFEVMHKGERRHPFCAMAENTAEGGEGKLPQTPEKKY